MAKRSAVLFRQSFVLQVYRITRITLLLYCYTVILFASYGRHKRQKSFLGRSARGSWADFVLWDTHQQNEGIVKSFSRLPLFQECNTKRGWTPQTTGRKQLTCTCLAPRTAALQHACMQTVYHDDPRSTFILVVIRVLNTYKHTTYSHPLLLETETALIWKVAILLVVNPCVLASGQTAIWLNDRWYR